MEGFRQRKSVRLHGKQGAPSSPSAKINPRGVTVQLQETAPSVAQGESVSVGTASEQASAVTARQVCGLEPVNDSTKNHSSIAYHIINIIGSNLEEDSGAGLVQSDRRAESLNGKLLEQACLLQSAGILDCLRPLRLSLKVYILTSTHA